MSARLIDTVKFDSPLAKLAVSNTTQYIAVATARLDSYNSVFIIGEEGYNDTGEAVIRQVPSLFPPSTIALNPTADTGGAEFTLAVAGEAIALWDSTEQLLAYCVPELFASHARYDISNGLGPGLNETPVWSITHLEWSKHQPHSLLACHRSGPLCCYPIQRLPSAQKSWMDLDRKSSSPNASLMQLAKRLASKVFAPSTTSDNTSESTPSRLTGSGNARTAGPHYEIVAQPLMKTPQSPSTMLSTSNPRYFTCAKFFGNPSTIIASKAGSSSLQVFDVRQKADTVAWDVTLTGISKLCVQPSESPTYVLGLDKQCGMIRVFDLRKKESQTVEAFASYSVNDLFDENTLINDISWSDKCPDQVYVALQHKNSEQTKWQPLARIPSIMFRSMSDERPRYITVTSEATTYSSNRLQSCSVVTAVEALDSQSFVATRMMGDINYETEDGDIVQLLPPPNASTSLRNMRFIANKGWHLTFAELEAT